MSDPLPVPGSKASRLSASMGRVLFWRIWAEEAVTAEARAYFASRLRHWSYIVKSIEIEP